MAEAMNKEKMHMLLQGARSQKKSTGFKATKDPNVKMFKTPLEKAILVYIPKTNVYENEEGVEDFGFLPSLLHSVKKGKYEQNYRCIDGFKGQFFEEEYGYDGECPLCSANAKSWELYNAKMEEFALKKGIDLKNANREDESIKHESSKNIQEMAVSTSEEFMTFPVCIIPNTEVAHMPADNALEGIETVYVQWRKKRVEEKLISGGIKKKLNKIPHLGGTIWVWDFRYNTEGKTPDPMIAANKAKYTTYTVDEILGACEDEATKEYFLKVIAECEIKASTYTVEHALDMIYATEFLHKDKVLDIADGAIADTQLILDGYKAKKAGIGVGVAQGSNNALLGATVPNQQMGAATIPTMGSEGTEVQGGWTGQQTSTSLNSFGKE